MLQLSFQLSSLLLELLQLHGQTHIALDLQLALEECLLSIQLALHQVHQVVVTHDDGHVCLACTVITTFNMIILLITSTMTIIIITVLPQIARLGTP